MKSEENLKKLKAIHEVLAAHGIQIHDVIPTSVGPSFSQFRVTPLPGKNLSGVRLIAPKMTAKGVVSNVSDAADDNRSGSRAPMSARPKSKYPTAIFGSQVRGE